MGFYKRGVKRFLDFMISLVFLVILFPILLIISLFIKFDSKGPIIFKQKRLGYNGKEFYIFKFRTMCVGAEKSGSGLVVKSDKDNRITKVGRFLRKISLDELPQLINILKGDMAIVGPRPPVTYFPYNGFENYPDWTRIRFSVRPGVTGLAQVVVRNSVPWEKRFEYDIEYVNKLTPMLDIKLFLKTIHRVIKPRNIYLGGN